MSTEVKGYFVISLLFSMRGLKRILKGLASIVSKWTAFFLFFNSPKLQNMRNHWISNFQVIINLWKILLGLEWGTAPAPCISPFGYANKNVPQIFRLISYTKILSNFIKLRLRLLGEKELITNKAFLKSVCY